MPEILVSGLDSINRALNESSRIIKSDLRAELGRAAEPVKRDAEKLSLSEISGMKRSRVNWWVQRIGQNIHEVYVAPRERGVKSKTDRSRRRPNLATLMYGKAYVPALANNEAQVAASVDVWLDHVIRESSR